MHPTSSVPFRSFVGLAGMVFVASTGLFLAACSDSPTQPTPGTLQGAHIVFAQQDGTTFAWNLFTMGSDGSDIRRLDFSRENPGSDPDVILQKPRWSPNGNRIMYRASATNTEDWYLILMDRDGDNRKALTSSGGFADFGFWSPTGDRILYDTGSVFLGGLYQTVIADTSGTSMSFVIADEGAEFEGRQVFFNLSPRDGTTLYDAQWAPDGQHLFVVGFLDERPQDGVDVDQVEIFRVRISTGRIVERMTRNGFDEAGFVASPNGLRLVQAVGEGGDRRVRYGEFTDSTLTEVPGIVPDSEPRWSGDSRFLVFTAPIEGGVAVFDTETGTVRVVGPAEASGPDVFGPVNRTTN